MKNFEKSYIRVAKAPRFPQFIVRSGVPEQLPQYSDISRLANGDYVLLPNNDYDDGRKEGNIRPALVFYDSLFQISDTLFRYTPKHRMIEGVTSGLLLGKVLRSGGNVTLYQDMAGDTVFRVSAERKLIPEFVIDIPDNLKMTVRESEKSSYEEKEKKSQYVIMRYPGIMYAFHITMMELDVLEFGPKRQDNFCSGTFIRTIGIS